MAKTARAGPSLSPLLQSPPHRLDHPSIRPGAPGRRPRLRSIIVKSLEEGIALFNRRQFFEAHEVWEDGWRIADGGDRLLLHGLIQVAAGFHKLQCGQPGGCAARLSKGAEKLASVRSGGEDRLASRALLEAVEAWRETAVRMVETESTEYNAAALPVLPAPPAGHLAAAVYSQIEIDA